MNKEELIKFIQFLEDCVPRELIYGNKNERDFWELRKLKLILFLKRIRGDTIQHTKNNKIYQMKKKIKLIELEGGNQT